MGNIVNRVFDSSGPDGKVRGTPQQIIEKYQLLARDAQLSNDRVAAENFMQHAEHYTRMLGEAQREMAAEQEARRQQVAQNPQAGDRNGGQDGRDRPARSARDDQGGRYDQPEDRTNDSASGLMPALGFSDDEETGLVDTPEARKSDRDVPQAKPQPTAPTQAGEPVAQAEAQLTAPVVAEAAPESDAAAAPAKGRARGPRGPRRPRAPAGDAAKQDDPAAAE